MTSFYAGIGSQTTPDHELTRMTHCARVLASMGFWLRSGGADGADTAFETGAGDTKEIYLPWPGFNGSLSPFNTVEPDALAMAKKYHPAWGRLTPRGQKFMARNCYQMLGKTLDTPVKFVVCWTPGGRIVGGTGQALRIAAALEIPVFNLATDPDLESLAVYLGLVTDETAT